ncbi:MAG TPA: GNAT family N-acetyltransferase [Vicinamibacterales bacterium]
MRAAASRNVRTTSRATTATRLTKKRGPVAVRRAQPVLRAATSADVQAIHVLISTHLREGHLLPRSVEDIEAHVSRFIVAAIGDRIVACADLAPLSPLVAEVRSLVVDASARSEGLGQRIINELAHRARVAGFDSLCAFTHSAGYFVRMGFSIVPHPWIPEKIEADCRSCPLFRHCGQYAVTLPLAHGVESFVPLASLHG